LEFSEYFLRIWRTLKNFAKLSGGWKEGMVWLQDFLENENGPSGLFVCLDFLENILRILDFVGIIWTFCSKSGLPGESGTALFEDRDYYCRVPNTGD
jgi:hypothetical protein